MNGDVESVSNVKKAAGDATRLIRRCRWGRRVMVAVAVACLLPLAGCADDDAGGVPGASGQAPGGTASAVAPGQTPGGTSGKPRLPDRIGAAELIDAWDGREPNNPPDTPLASDKSVDEQGAAYRLVQEMVFLGYTDTRDWQGGYYYDPAPAAGRPGYLMVIIASAGKTSPEKLVRQVIKGDADEPNPGETGTEFGGTYTCSSSSCLWADDKYLVDVLTDGLDAAAIRTLIHQIRTGAPT